MLIKLKRNTYHLRRHNTNYAAALKSLIKAIFKNVLLLWITHNLNKIFCPVLLTYRSAFINKTTLSIPCFYASSVSTRYALIGWQKFTEKLKWPIRDELMKIGASLSFVTGQISTIFVLTSHSGFCHWLPSWRPAWSQSEWRMHPAHGITVKKSTETAALSCEIAENVE